MSFRARGWQCPSVGFLTHHIFNGVRVYQRLLSIVGILRQDGYCVIRLSHLLVARRLLRKAATLISLFHPPPSPSFKWVTDPPLDRNCMFIFFSFSQNFWWKIEFDAQGQGRKLGKIAYFPPIQPFATPSNEWQNKISVGDGILCWILALAI